MLNIGSVKIYLCTGATDMRKGMNGLTLAAKGLLQEKFCDNAMFVFRGKRADRIKMLWWDGQEFCLYYKCLNSGKFIWPNSSGVKSVNITKAQLAMLMEGIDWVRQEAVRRTASGYSENYTDEACCFASSFLPGHAMMVTSLCEALGTM